MAGIMEDNSTLTAIKTNNTEQEIDRMIYCLTFDKHFSMPIAAVNPQALKAIEKRDYDKKIKELQEHLHYDNCFEDQIILKTFTTIRYARRALPELMANMTAAQIDDQLQNLENLIKSDLMKTVTERVAGIKISENIK